MHPPGSADGPEPSALNRRGFLKRSSKLGAALLSGGGGLAAAAAPERPTPPLTGSACRPVPALKAGGTVAVIAPASPATGKAQQVSDWLLARGFVPRLFPSAMVRTDDYLAGTDTLRLEDLHTAFADPTIDAIFCLRGGYGSGRLLDRIDFDLLSRHPKPFVGYSDITALLLAIMQHAGFVVFHGPMLAPDLLPNKAELTETALFAMLQQPHVPGNWLPHATGFALETIRAGTADGRLVGGNLAMIGSTLGSRYEIELDNAILFIEDVGETPQKIDRLLTQLRLAGKLAQLKGILIGDFSEINDPRAHEDHTAANLQRLRLVWRDLLEPLEIPILAGWRSGHCSPNLTLPIGARIHLDASSQRLRLEQQVIGNS
jgi:muramoyltetrapeptide carboxypeptidase